MRSLRRALPCLVASLLASGSSAATAAQPRVTLIYDDDLGKAMERLEAQGLDGARVDAYRLSTLWQGRAPVILGAEARSCRGTPTTNSSLRANSELAESMYFNREVESALETIEEATRGLGCLDRELEESLAARAWFLQGVIHDDLGQDQAARQAFDRARVFDRDLEWDSDFDARPETFTDEPRWAGSSEQATLHLGPLPLAHARVAINGLAPQPGSHQVKLPPGEHLVQVLDPEPRTFTLTLEPAQEAWLVVPGDKMDELLSQLPDPAIQAWLTVLLRAWPLGAPLEEAWLIHGQQSWRYLAPGQWELMERPRRPLAEPTLRLSGQTLLVGGLGALAAFTADLLQTRQAIATLPERGYWPEAEPQLQAELERGLQRDGQGIAISAGTASVGFGLWLASRLARPEPGRELALTPGWNNGMATVTLRAELP